MAARRGGTTRTKVRQWGSAKQGEAGADAGGRYTGGWNGRMEGAVGVEGEWQEKGRASMMTVGLGGRGEEEGRQNVRGEEERDEGGQGGG